MLFVGTALPRREWTAEVDISFGGRGDDGVVGHLTTLTLCKSLAVRVLRRISGIAERIAYLDFHALFQGQPFPLKGLSSVNSGFTPPPSANHFHPVHTDTPIATPASAADIPSRM
jgi:hypothetical protein